MQYGRNYLEGAGAVHLFADDLLDFLERAHAERQICIEPAGDLAHQTCAHKQPVGIDFSVAGIFPESLYERF